MKPNEQTLKNLEKLKKLKEIAAGCNQEDDSIEQLKQSMRQNYLTKEDFMQIHDALEIAFYEAKEKMNRILEVYEHLEKNAQAHGFYERIAFSSLQRALSIKKEEGLKNDQRY